jgi:hypothetical protein
MTTRTGRSTQAKKRHERLGLHSQADEKAAIDNVESSFKGLGNYNPTWAQDGLRRYDVNEALLLALFRHLEYDVSVDPRQRATDGAAVFEDYMTGDWWKTERGYEKGPFNKGFWIDTYAKGLVLCLLLEREDLLERCSAPLESKHRHGSPMFDLIVTDAYLVIAYCLSGRTKQSTRIRTRIKKSKCKEAKLILDCWESIENMDQSAFESTLKASFDYFIKRRNEADPYAQHATVLALLGRRAGLALPELSEAELDWLILPETAFQ